MKKVLMGLGIVLALAIGVFVVMAVISGGEKEIVLDEFSELADMMEKENPDFDAILKKCDTLVSTGEYKKIEEAGKEYLKDFVNVTVEMKELLESNEFATLLTADTYKSDGPKFTKNRAFVKESKNKIKDYENKYTELLTEEKIMSYVKDKNVSKSDEKFYRDQVIGDFDNSEKELTDALNDLIVMLDGTIAIYDFLEANAGKWEVQNNQVMFDSNELINQYNDLVKTLQ